MTPAPDVVSAVMAVAERATISDDEAARLRTLRDREERYQRVQRFAFAVSAEDVQRIVRRKLDSVAWGHVVAFMRLWREGKARFLWLCGPTGRGKTVAALGALAEVGGVYVTADEVRRAFAQETDEARDLRFRTLSSRLVIVDDAGTERRADQASQATQELLNKRQGRGMCTILTCNLSRADLVERYDERTVSRVEHQGSIVVVGGEDMRRKGDR